MAAGSMTIAATPWVTRQKREQVDPVVMRIRQASDSGRWIIEQRDGMRWEPKSFHELPVNAVRDLNQRVRRDGVIAQCLHCERDCAPVGYWSNGNLQMISCEPCWIEASGSDEVFANINVVGLIMIYASILTAIAMGGAAWHFFSR